MANRGFSISLPEETVEELASFAGYLRVPVEAYMEQVLQDSHRRLSRGRAGFVRLGITEAEARLWSKEAGHLGIPLSDWIRRVVAYVVATRLEHLHGTTLGRAAMTTLLTGCSWCETELPGTSTVRRLYCSDRCRVQSWRAQRKALAQADGIG